MEKEQLFIKYFKGDAYGKKRIRWTFRPMEVTKSK